MKGLQSVSLEVKVALAKLGRRTQRAEPRLSGRAEQGQNWLCFSTSDSSGASCAAARVGRAGEPAKREGLQKSAAVVWEPQGQQQHPRQLLSSCKFIFIGLAVLLKGAEIHSAPLSFVSYRNIFQQHFQCPLPVRMSNGGK